MNKAKVKKILVGTISAGCTALLLTALIVPFTLALYVKGAQSEGFFGEISLRSYFECGSGSENDPYVITRPRHLYNLSRLQGLGLFGEKTYFELGLVGLNGDQSGQPRCYLDDTSSTVVPFLDMTDSNYDYEPINAIGSEAMPFYGEFNGHGLEIKNLTVYADPQDAGLFGYTAHGSEVHNLFLSNVTINALGYTSDYSDLYSPESTIGNNAYFSYNPNDGSAAISFNSSNHNTEYTYFYADENFEYTAQGSSPIPAVTIVSPSNTYTFTSLLSGDLIKKNNNQIVPDMDRLFSFFAEKNKGNDFRCSSRSDRNDHCLHRRQIA